MTDLRWLGYEQRFEYLSPEDSKLYADVKDSAEPKDRALKGLLEKLAAASRAAHRGARY